MTEPDFKSEGLLLLEALGLAEAIVGLDFKDDRATMAASALKVMWERGVAAGMLDIAGQSTKSMKVP